MKKIKTIGILSCACLFAGILLLNLAHAYHAFVSNSGSNTAKWATVEFSTDNTTVNLPDSSTTPASDGVNNGIPNNDTLGLLYVVDAHVDVLGVTPRDCDAGGTIYENSTQEPYNSLYGAMVPWSSVTSSIVNLQYVCLLTDLDITSVDGTISGNLDIYNSSTGNFVLNGYNEVIFDDTANLGIMSAIFSGFDPSTILGLGVPLDASGNLVFESGFTNPIAEAFIMINETPASPVNASNLIGTMVHEIGHTLGLAHTGSIMNASAIINGTTFNNGSTPGSNLNVPTMYAFLLPGTDDTQTLEIDDIAVITRQYPTGTAATDCNCGAISGQVLNNSGQPVDGAAVIAYDASGREVGVIVGGNPLFSNGNYRIDFVPAGTYTVTLRKLDGSADAAGISSFGNIDSIFPSSPFTFTQQFYQDSTLESAATSVNVVVNMETTNINFFNVATGSGGNSGSNGPTSVVALSDTSGSCNANPALPFAQGWGTFLLLLLPWIFLRQCKKQNA